KLCRPQEASSFIKELISSGLFELPDEKLLFKNCKESSKSFFSKVYIEIVSGEEVRMLSYSKRFKCYEKEWDAIQKIENLFETDWFENSKGR
ncbi:MAG TPA: hypothetical protein VIN08_11560, partial [Ohtaekwangia sp.]|uniref:hypothetical protein n=1 Tax=Ohtaekwangia sp. TaxID=2066019 RepID=UPI002F941181